MNKSKPRRSFTAEFKTKVVLEALREHSTIAQLAIKYDIQPVLISKWKADFLANAPTVFENKRGPAPIESVDVERLYAQIGRLKVEVDFLKKASAKLGL